MDGGEAAVERQLDSFSVAFPLPYRIAFIVILGSRFPIPTRTAPGDGGPFSNKS